MEVNVPTRLSCNLVADCVAVLARPVKFGALAAAEEEERSLEVKQNILAVVGLGPIQEEAVD